MNEDDERLIDDGRAGQLKYVMAPEVIVNTQQCNECRQSISQRLKHVTSQLSLFTQCPGHTAMTSPTTSSHVHIVTLLILSF